MICCLTLALITACAQEAPLDGNHTIETAPFHSSLDIDLEASERQDSGLWWRDIAVGEGPVVTRGQSVDVYYDGRLIDGSQFDATQVGQPFTFTAGVGRVIAGWDQGVVGMRVGGKRQLIIPSELGYGARGVGPIPPDVKTCV